ncbi:MAG: 50S ribosomal protein L16 [Candidatus Gracilibacteria bacterium]|nr:50S ribosomal protein L16 [Candidatus Gracilibacteria bacterium]
MLQPKRTKYRKAQRGGRIKGKATRGTSVSFGTYGLKAISSGQVTSRQLEAARQAIARSVKRGGKTWIRVFPDKPVTATAAETPMGSGKGSVEYYVAVVRAGKILFEMGGVTEIEAKEAFRLAGHKLPLRTRFVTS